MYLAKKAYALRSSPIEEALKFATPKVINFATGNPDPSVLPVNEIKECIIEAFNAYGARMLFYPDTGGPDELKREIARVLSLSGIKVSDLSEMLVTSGAQHAIKLISGLIDPSASLACENPTFYETLAPFAYNGNRIVGVEVLEDGMDLHKLEGELRKDSSIKFVYLNPTFHNPTGYCMSDEKKRWIVELASRYDFYIIEDDPYRPLTLNEKHPVKKYDDENRVIYVGSFSKVLGPGLRVGWILFNAEFNERARVLLEHDFSSSTVTQYAVLEFLRKYSYEDLCSKISKHYRLKMRVMKESLKALFGNAAAWTEPENGFFLLLKVPGLNFEDLLLRAVKEGVLYVPARRFYVGDGPLDVARLSVSRATLEEIPIGLAKLLKVISLR